ncbi:MAG: TolC family protein [Anaerohalosphaera sp.]|nr:TolC family protein [Anaerohalosphaera sp.]
MRVGSLVFVIIACFGFGRVLGGEGSLTELSDYIEYAAAHNAGLAASYESAVASMQGEDQAKSLPDPQFTYNYFFEQIETKVGPQRQKVGLKQMFPWFGTIDVKRSAARKKAAAAMQRYAAQGLKLTYEVTDAYCEYAYLKFAIDKTSESMELVKHFEEVARTKYAASTAGQSDVIHAQIVLARLDDKLESLKDLRGAMVVKLNSILNRKSDETLPWPDRVKYRPVAINQQEVIGRLLANNPELKSLDLEVAVADEMISLAKKAFYPDITLGVEWIDTGNAAGNVHDSGKDAVVGMFAISVPLWTDGYKAGERQSRAAKRMVQAQRVQQENEIITRATKVLYDVKDRSRKVNLYGNTLVPKAEEMLEATEAAYQVGQVDFSTLIESQRQLLDFQLANERAVVETAQRHAELNMLMGVDIREFQLQNAKKTK